VSPTASPARTPLTSRSPPSTSRSGPRTSCCHRDVHSRTGCS
jgi:hypothetical protein